MKNTIAIICTIIVVLFIALIIFDCISPDGRGIALKLAKNALEFIKNVYLNVAEFISNTINSFIHRASIEERLEGVWR